MKNNHNRARIQDVAHQVHDHWHLGSRPCKSSSYGVLAQERASAGAYVNDSLEIGSLLLAHLQLELSKQSSPSSSPQRRRNFHVDFEDTYAPKTSSPQPPSTWKPFCSDQSLQSEAATMADSELSPKFAPFIGMVRSSDTDTTLLAGSPPY